MGLPLLFVTFYPIGLAKFKPAPVNEVEKAARGDITRSIDQSTNLSNKIIAETFMGAPLCMHTLKALSVKSCNVVQIYYNIHA